MSLQPCALPPPGRGIRPITATGASARELDMIVIDCHCHAGKGDGLTGPWNTSAPLRDFVRWSRRAGITRTNLFAAFHSDYARANRQVASIVRAFPKLFYGFAF